MGEPENSFLIDGRAFAGATLEPGLYLVATPIGNLNDITLRALHVLASCSQIACEDTRKTGRLLNRFGIETPMIAYHDHSRNSVRDRILRRLAEEGSVALVSDAGTPLLSDPGLKLVRAAIHEEYGVHPVPGASSITAALCVAGLPTDSFLFAGFLPTKAAARRQRLDLLAKVPSTLVFLESPRRIAASLEDLAAVLGGERPAALCRELTKLHETIYRDCLADLAAAFAQETTKGEIVVVVGPPDPGAESLPQKLIDSLLADALREGTGVRSAVEQIAHDTGLSRRALYRRALELSREREK